MRSQKQAESEDCDQVDIEHFEKILPQLVRSSTKEGHMRDSVPTSIVLNK